MSDEANENSLEDLELRAKPRPVLKLKKSVIIMIAGIALIIIMGALMFAMRPPEIRSVAQKELYNISHKAKPEVLEILPETYEDVVIKLGPPLPGDLGSAVTTIEKTLA